LKNTTIKEVIYHIIKRGKRGIAGLYPASTVSSINLQTRASTVLDA